MNYQREMPSFIARALLTQPMAKPLTGWFGLPTVIGYFQLSIPAMPVRMPVKSWTARPIRFPYVRRWIMRWGRPTAARFQPLILWWAWRRTVAVFPTRRALDIGRAISLGLNVDCGLHDYLSEDPEMMKLAVKFGIKIRDIRKPPPIEKLHFFSGRIEGVRSLKIAVLGTDSAIGKRTTAWLMVNGFKQEGLTAEMIGTGQTAWMQGARYGIMMDSLVNDFVAGEIEHAVWRAWDERKPEVIVIEGQGSLMNPAYPGGFEILAAGRPDIIVLQHAPARKEYDGFPGYPIQPLAQQIEVIELLSGKPVVAVAINHENLSSEQVPLVCSAIEQTVGLPAFDVLRDGPQELIVFLKTFLEKGISKRRKD